MEPEISSESMASGVVIPSWGLLPLAAHWPAGGGPKIVAYVHCDGGPTWDFFVTRPLTPPTTCNAGGAGDSPQRQAALAPIGTTRHFSLHTVNRDPDGEWNQHAVE